jgi:hypothetical protein
MDWSESMPLTNFLLPANHTTGLLDFYAPKTLLRENLAFKNTWWYYAAMIIDPILRFNWIFYIIFTGQLQTSALLSFGIAFSEVCRRGIWTIFRVENEHCTNVGRFRASRDVPLPYDFKQPETIAEEGGLLAPLGEEQEMDEAQFEEQGRQGIKPSPSGLSDIPSRASGADIYRTHTQQSVSSSTVRRRRKLEASPLIRRMGSILHMAHAQDFERKKRPEAGAEVSKSSEDDDDEDTSDEVEEELEEQVDAAERAADEEMARVDGVEEEEEVKKREGSEEDKSGETGADENDESGEGGVHWKFSDVDEGHEGEEDRGEMSSGPQSPGGHPPK